MPAPERPANYIDTVKAQMAKKGYRAEMRCSTKKNADYWAGRFKSEKGWTTVIKRVASGVNKLLSPDHWIVFVKK